MHASSKQSSQPVVQRGGQRLSFFRYTAIAAAVALSLGGLSAIARPGAVLPETSPLTIGETTSMVPAGFSEVIRSVQPAVVSITVDAGAGSRLGGNKPELELPDDPHFKEFFGRFFRYSPDRPDTDGRDFKVRGVGSGFIVTADGYIVTNSHVVENASQIHVVLDDGQRLPARVRGRDPKTDLALLKVDAPGELPYVAFGNSDVAEPGDWVVAIGNPFGLGGTATTGIISARGRDINSGPYDDYLQIDAPINRGNSGGPLFDLRGRVIGVNTAIYSPDGANVGIGFAVPAAQAKSVIAQLMQNGKVERGWLGVQIQGLDAALAESVDLPGPSGALVADVTQGSPAARAGIQVGDVILSFNGQEIGEMRDLPRLVAEVTAGQKTELVLWRKGQKRRLDVTVASLAGDTLAAAEVAPEALEGPRLGLALATITLELRRELDLAEGVEGALVVGVEPESPAAREGLQRGDVIVQADHKTVTTPGDVAGVVQAKNADNRNRVLLLINRHGSQRFVTVQLG